MAISETTRRAGCRKSLPDHGQPGRRRVRSGAASWQVAAEALKAGGVRLIEKPRWDDVSVKRLDRLAQEGDEADPGWDDEWTEGGWDDEGEEDAPRAASGAVPTERIHIWVVVHACTDWQKQGHVDGYSSNPGRKRAADMSSEEREAAAAERRDVIQSNKDWDSAKAFPATASATPL